MYGQNGSKLKEYLPIVTLADRVSTKPTKGYSQFQLPFGKKAVLPIDSETNTYLAIEWNKISRTEELLEEKTIQIAEKEEKRLAEAEELRDSRKKSVQHLNKKMAHRLRNPLEPGDWVLVYNMPLDSQWGLLFKKCWNGPYRVINHKLIMNLMSLKNWMALSLQENFQQVTSRGFIPEERKLNQVQSQKIKAVKKSKMKSQYWREKKLNKMNMINTGKPFS
ncbi:hypothetical protein O181_029272 [Austropuccinia psidii MF-1]|uniref:Uncharacterized protein n=1 Tax=Austropuccinia psidii MF-1 TaxID=1389203 RepID=A0A9Q3CW91_9BASI|nr:hypothetical protein [Austropuccinia psidii MF-1]